MENQWFSTIENCRVDSDGVPESDVRISDCGMWEKTMGFCTSVVRIGNWR